MKFNLYILILLQVLASFTSQAIDLINPKELCTRFISDTEKKKCLQTINAQQVDSYLAFVCQKQFKDAEFWSCIYSAQNQELDPIKLDKCAADSLSDEERVGCIKRLAMATKDKKLIGRQSYQNLRMPASIKRLKPVKSVKHDNADEEPHQTLLEHQSK